MRQPAAKLADVLRSRARGTLPLHADVRLRIDTASAVSVLVDVDLPDHRPRLLNIEPEPQHQPLVLGPVPILKFCAGVHHP